jgi:hypothetical protein
MSKANWIVKELNNANLTLYRIAGKEFLQLLIRFSVPLYDYQAGKGRAGKSRFYNARKRLDFFFPIL